MRSKAFKIEMVRLVESSGKSISQMSQELGIARTTLMLWCSQFGQAPARLCLFCQRPLHGGVHGNRRVHQECQTSYERADEQTYQASENGRRARAEAGRRFREAHPTYAQEYYQQRRDHYREWERAYVHSPRGREVRRKSLQRWREKIRKK